MPLLRAYVFFTLKINFSPTGLTLNTYLFLDVFHISGFMVQSFVWYSRDYTPH